MSNSKPSISIIVPCYNQGHFLDEAIASVLKQDHPLLDIIIINDGSTDDTAQKANAWAIHDSRIRVIHQENQGLSAARNRGIEASKGDFLHFLDADDFVFEGFYSQTLAKLHADKADICIAGYTYYSAEQGLFHNVTIPLSIDLKLFFEGNIAPPVAYLVSRHLVIQAGSFDTGLKSAEDWDFWLRAAKAGAVFTTLSIPLVAYRYVAGSMSRDAFRMYEALKTVATRAPRKDARLMVESSSNKDYAFNTNPVIKRCLLQCLGISLMQGKVEESLKLFKRESEIFGLIYAPNDFGVMCSYLSFRYWYTNDEIKRVFNTIYPNFEQFFNEVSLSSSNRKAILKVILKRHIMYSRKSKFGIVGSLFNALDRLLDAQ